MDPQASDALLVAARLIEHMRDRWIRYGAGQPEAGMHYIGFELEPDYKAVADLRMSIRQYGLQLAV